MTTPSIPAAEAEPSLLLTSERWSEQQILKAMQANVTTFMGKLPPDEQQEYLRLCNELIEREQHLSTTLNDFYNDLNQQLADALQSALKSKTGKQIDPRTTYLKTRVRQLPIAQDDLPANDRLSDQVRIFKEDLSVREYERSMTLLEAAHRNFGFTAYFSTEEQRASFISDSALSVKEFVAVVRSVDFGKRIGDYIENEFKKRLYNALFGLQGTKLVIALRDAYRTREPWSINEWEFNNLKNALFDANIHWDMYQLDAGGDKIAMPFFTRHFDTPDGACVYSYFPDRPDGALRRHTSRKEAVDDLQKQIRNDVGLKHFGWFMKAISLNNQEKIRTFIKPLKVNRDELYWHARILYDLFASKTPNREKLTVEKIGPDTRALAHTLPVRQSWPIQADLIRLARTNQLADREAAVALLTYLVSETLSMLLIAVPGGVTGMSKVMLIAMMGTLAYQTGSAISALRRGQQAELVQAVGDILDLLVGLRLQAVASKLSVRRTRKLMSALGNPRYGVAADGKPGLWFVDAERAIDPSFLDGVAQNSQGVFEKNTYSYAKLEVDGKSRIVEVKLDKGSGRYRLTGDASSVLPYITFLPARNHWVLDPVDTRALSDAQLLQQMVSPSQLSLTTAACQRALHVAGVDRQGLQDIWFAHQSAPVSLIQAIEHQGLYEGARQLQTTLKQTDDPTISLLRRRFPDLSRARAAELLQQHPSLREASEYSALAAPVREAIHKGREQSLITEALSALSTPSDRGFNAQSEALFGNLLTLLPGWPSDVAVQVYQGVTDQAGDIVGRGALLNTYGNDDADSFVMLVKSGNRYAGYQQDSGTLQKAIVGENSLLSATLRTLTDTQRDDLGRGLHDNAGLAQDVLKQAHVHREYLHEFLIPSRELPLSSQSLSAFRIPYKQLPNNADVNGIHEMSQRKYVSIDDGTYQVMLDRDASSATHTVWRIVKPGDAVAMDEGNVYNSSRAGETHAITRNTAKVWVSAIVGAQGGMRGSGHDWNFHRQLADSVTAVTNRLRTPQSRVRRLFPAFTEGQVNLFIQTLGGNINDGLAQRETEYKNLKRDLKAWTKANTAESTGPRERIAKEIKRCWRREAGTLLKIPPHLAALPALKADFSHVRELVVESVNWSEAADTFLGNFTGLEQLSITDSKLDKLPAMVGELHDLTTLNLRSNHIQLDAQHAAKLANLSKLEHLNLSGNPLGIPPDFSAMVKLQTLDLSSTQINQWPNGLNNLSALKVVDLRNNQLHEVPEANLNPIPDQLDTVARVNGVTLLEGNPFPAGYWRILEKYRRRLATDHPELSPLSRIDAFRLEADAHEIAIVQRMYPEKNAQAAREYLSGLGDNTETEMARIQAFDQLDRQLVRYIAEHDPNAPRSAGTPKPDSAYASKSIRECWLKSADTLRLPSLNAPLPALTADFSHVKILSIDSVTLATGASTFLANFPNLVSLSIAYSNIETLPASIGRMKNLDNLSLRSNHMKLDVESAAILSSLNQLAALDLSENSLQITPDFSTMTRLNAVNLSNTGISQWPAGLMNLPSLAHLDLRDNKLREVPQAHLNPAADDLQTVARINAGTRLEGNPFPAQYWKKFDEYWQRLHDTHPELADPADPAAFDVKNSPAQRYRKQHPTKPIKECRERIWRLGQGVPTGTFSKQLELLKAQLDYWVHAEGGDAQGSSSSTQGGNRQRTDLEQARERIVSCWQLNAPERFAANGASIGLELDLSGLKLPNLPAISADFKHVGSLRLSNMSLEAIPNNFLRQFHHLRWLDMSNNLLRDLPEGMSEMNNLTRLFLQKNQLTLTTETAHVLAGRITLRALWLNDNPGLGAIPDFSQVTDMREVNLSNTGIDTWPVGLFTQPGLGRLNLSHNRITTIPDFVVAPTANWLAHSVQVNSGTQVSHNPLSSVSRMEVNMYEQRLLAAGMLLNEGPNLITTAAVAKDPESTREI
ncbi:leucine-rich repeat domain-containing protein [Pseudomonas sp. AM4(2022)]|uniref:leucine-rich repeat domain-containing protein n=1 Tax=Pseudomonas sp. AM4(2022) TaxID=2983408 RepID=UPI002E818F39|nr:leucine-rich repeat domain-containing protein [Pseudomonas sp. AM4(2022)]